MVSFRLLGMAVLAILTMSAVPVLIKSSAANEITIGIARLCIATALLTPWVLGRAGLRSLSLAQWRAMAIIGAVFAVHWLLYFLSIKLSTATVGALAMSTYGIQYLFLARVFNGEHTSTFDWLAVTICLGGCLLVVPEFSLDNDITAGLLVGVLSGTLYAALPLLHQRLSNVATVTRTWGQFAFGLLCMLPFAGYSNWQLDPLDYYRLAVLGVVCTVVAHGLWVKVTTELPAIYPSTIYYLYLPLTMASSTVFLQESMTPGKLAGATLIISASLAATLYRLTKREKTSTRRH